MKDKFRDVWARTRKAAESASEQARETYREKAPAIRDQLNRKGQDLKRSAEKGVEATKAFVDSKQETIDGVCDGLKEAAKSTAEGAAGVIITDAQIDALSHDVHVQSLRWRGLTKRWHDRASGDADTMRDCLTIGGITMAHYAVAGVDVPDDVQLAYETAFPHVADRSGLSDHINSLDPDALTGFAAALKGKLFEVSYVEYLNKEGLEDGFRADLAASPTNAGWDIAVSGPDGEIAELIQAKATDSVAYVKSALEAYPHIDVVTTSEVYNQLALQGLSEGIINSGMSESGLADAIDHVGQQGTFSGVEDLVPPVICLALIAFTGYRKEDLTAYERACQAGDRTGHAAMALAVGYGLASVSGIAIFAPAVSVAYRKTIGAGRLKFQLWQGLTRRKSENAQAIRQLCEGLKVPSPAMAGLLE